jgi:hypothetical protein
MSRLVWQFLPPSQSNDETLDIAYFAFLLETVQTALTGADVYYWFIEGFENVEHIKNSHFAAIDIPIIHSTISFVVQEYFCYRIWTLNRRSSKLCILITLVRVKSPLSKCLDSGFCIQLTILSSVGSGWGGIEASTTQSLEKLTTKA